MHITPAHSSTRVHPTTTALITTLIEDGVELLATEVVGEVAVETAEWVVEKVVVEVEKREETEAVVIPEVKGFASVSANHTAENMSEVDCPNRYWYVFLYCRCLNFL